jgi:methanogenic corrinoid protein MtbC1
LILAYLGAGLSGERRRAVDLLLSAVDNGLDVRRAYTEVLQEAQRRVGEMWLARELAIAQEHSVTATTNIAMALLAQVAGGERQSSGKTVVVSVVPGNAHLLGAQALAHFFEMEGWNSIHLGSEMPANEISTALDVFQADLLALSVTLSTHLRAAMETIESARKTRPGVKVLVGGRAIAAAPNLWRKLAADGAANTPSEALEVANRLTGQAPGQPPG